MTAGRNWSFAGLAGPLLVGAALIGLAAPAPARPRTPKHILVVTHTTGFRHTDSINAAEVIIKDMGEKSGDFDVDYARTLEDVQQKMSPEGLKRYDAVFFCQTTGDVGVPDKQAFLDWIKAGHGFIGTHSATDTYHNGSDRWPAYIDLIGAEFMTHGKQVEVQVNVEDPHFPAVKALPRDMQKGFKVFDEIYEFVPASVSRKRDHVILSMSRHPQTGAPGDYWVSWDRCYGKGKVFYTSLGHRPDVWEQPWYQAYLLGGIRWTLGLARGSCRPSEH